MPSVPTFDKVKVDFSQTENKFSVQLKDNGTTAFEQFYVRWTEAKRIAESLINYFDVKLIVTEEAVVKAKEQG